MPVIALMLAAGFTATTDASVIADAATVVICVPTPLTPEGGPDLGPVLGATRAIAKHLRPGQLVVLESTTYPGTTDDEVRPILEESGLRAGVAKLERQIDDAVHHRLEAFRRNAADAEPARDEADAVAVEMAGVLGHLAGGRRHDEADAGTGVFGHVIPP